MKATPRLEDEVIGSLFIRVDSNPEIASGHMMRCLAIAEELDNRGFSPFFVVSDETSALLPRSFNFQTVVLQTDWKDIESEITVFKAILKPTKRRKPVILIDTYSITEKYITEMSNVARLCYLGVKRGRFEGISALVNYDVGISESSYKDLFNTRNTTFLLGPSYAPLRSKFSGSPILIKEAVKNILVTTGATDAPFIVPRILSEAIMSSALSSVRFDVVLGSMYSNSTYLKETYGACERVSLHEEVRDMASLMRCCDVAVSACGTTVHELAALGVPTVYFSISREQDHSAKKLERLGVAEYCGRAHVCAQEVAEVIVNKLGRLVQSKDRRASLAASARMFVDGKGASRIADLLLELAGEPACAE